LKHDFFNFIFKRSQNQAFHNRKPVFFPLEKQDVVVDTDDFHIGRFLSDHDFCPKLSPRPVYLHPVLIFNHG
jgi:hypothetical protein